MNGEARVGTNGETWGGFVEVPWRLFVCNQNSAGHVGSMRAICIYRIFTRCVRFYTSHKYHVGKTKSLAERKIKFAVISSANRSPGQFSGGNITCEPRNGR